MNGARPLLPYKPSWRGLNETLYYVTHQPLPAFFTRGQLLEQNFFMDTSICRVLLTERQIHKLGLASGGKINLEGCFEGSGALPDVANLGLYRTVS